MGDDRSRWWSIWWWDFDIWSSQDQSHGANGRSNRQVWDLRAHFLCYVINVMVWVQSREEERLLSLEKSFKSCLWLASELLQTSFSSLRLGSSEAFWYDRNCASSSRLPLRPDERPWIIHKGLILKLVICFIAKVELQNALAPSNESPRGFLMPRKDSSTEPQKNSPSHLVVSRSCLVSISAAHLDARCTLAQMCADAQSHSDSSVSLKIHV